MKRRDEGRNGRARAWIVGVCATLVAWSCGGTTGGASDPDASAPSGTGGDSTTGGTGGDSTSGAGGDTGGVGGSGSGGAGGAPTSGPGGSSGRAGSGGGIVIGTGGTGIDADASCVSQALNASPVPTDVLILQDKSGSMACDASDDACQNPVLPMMPPSRWDAMTAAVTTFVNSPAPAMAGIGVGLVFFGLSDGSVPCTAESYATPVVPIAPLPGNAMPIVNAIAATMPSGATPTAPALQGAINYARAYTMQLKGRSAAVLLVTDGVPTGCTQTGVTTAVDAASAGFMGSPQVKTFVVGMGDTAALDQVALAGSGGSTHYIPTMGDVTGTIVRALSTITGITTCVFAMPTSGGGSAVDPRLVNVILIVGGAVQRIGHVDSAAACGTAGGWFYDSLIAPTQIILCPVSCNAVSGSPGNSVRIAYGCPTVPP